MNRVIIPAFVTITETTPKGASDAEFVICNEATGKYFSANKTTVHFFSALKDTGQVPLALARAGIPDAHGEHLMKGLLRAGVISKPGETQSTGPIKAPLEGKAMSIRLDLFNAAPLVDRFAWVGRLLYSPFGYFFWVMAMILTLFQLLSNSDKVWLSLQQVVEASWSQWIALAVIYVSLKIVHEMGHGLAYSAMCRTEGVEPGPIRMGISTFAFTPFPFTDVTGAWRLRSKWRRMMIGAGGIYFETWMIAVLTLFWAQTQSGMIQTLVLQVAVIAGILTLAFNLNPAVKLDGYFILTDYLRQPNLAGRASQSARNLAAGLLGAKAPAPVGSELAYWVLSYSYRWTIFAGVFWMAYQFDKRIAPLALVIVVLTMVIRPLARTIGFAYKSGMKPLRATAFAIITAGIIGLSLVPFPDRILIPGQFMAFESQFIDAPESGYLRVNETGGYVIDAPQIDQQIADVSLRTEMLQNLERASRNAPEEKARLAFEISGFSETQDELTRRKSQLALTPVAAQVWTDINARDLLDTWITSTQVSTLGALSAPVAPYFRLRLDQSSVERDLPIAAGAPLKLRYVHNPDCEISATVTTSLQDAQIQGETLFIRAKPDDEFADCESAIRNGGAIVARLPTNPRSVLERVRFGISRMLQNRLIISNE